LAKVPSIVRTLLSGGDDTVLRMVIKLIEKTVAGSSGRRKSPRIFWRRSGRSAPLRLMQMT
jgi:hypothetical protein